MKNRIVLTFWAIFFNFELAQAYDVVKRYKLLQDKFKTEDMLRPLGHDFLIDTTLTANTNLKKFIKEAGDISKTEGTTIDKVNAATDFLQKYKDTEQTIRGKVNLGIPFFSFNLFGIKFSPDIRGFVDFGANIGIRTEALTLATLVQFLPQDTPSDIKEALLNLPALPAQGSDLIQVIDDAYPGDAALQAALDTLPRDTYLMPIDPTIPNIFAYTKIDGGVGPLMQFQGEKFFGHAFIYALYRRDLKARLSAESIARDQDMLDNVKKDNTTKLLDLDFKLGRDFDYFSLFFAVEEMKLSTIEGQKPDTGVLNFETDPLYRLHLDTDFRWGPFGVAPFLGTHQRKGYSASDGLYGGMAFFTRVWADRLGIMLRFMGDKEHLTITSRVKIWFVQLEYSMKKPMKSTVDEMKVSTLHTLDFRVFF